MNKRHFLLIVGSILVAGLVGLPFSPGTGAAVETLSARLSDQEFWRIVSDFSEPNGYFRSDNLLSNELWLQYVIPDLIRTAKPSRVYLGVGPEQNFTYIAALKPKMAFIIDIRRGNLHLHLMYKALFELSRDRAEFVSRLFSKNRPDGLGPESTAREIFAAYLKAETSEALYGENLKAIDDHLVTKRRLPLSAADREGIEYVYRNFYQFGPRINYSSSSGGFGGSSRATYTDLMVADDGNGQTRSYLATEEDFAFLKDLETKNLLVPVVGNFAGPKAIRSIGSYLKEKDARVSAFYLSNVEQFLLQDGVWNNFCRNVASLPLDETSTFIRAVRDGQFGLGRGLNSELGNMAADIMACTPAGR